MFLCADPQLSFSAVRFDVRRFESTSWAVCIGFDRSADFGLYNKANGATETAVHDAECASFANDDEAERVEINIDRNITDGVGYSYRKFQTQALLRSLTLLAVLN